VRLKKGGIQGRFGVRKKLIEGTAMLSSGASILN